MDYQKTATDISKNRGRAGTNYESLDFSYVNVIWNYELQSITKEMSGVLEISDKSGSVVDEFVLDTK